MNDPAPAQDLRRTVTCILNDLQAGRPEASDQLLPLVYDQLRAIAQQRMNEERAGHTLQATALVHEAYVRLVGDEDVAWADRSHFYAAAVEAMRRILIDHARRRGAVKRGGDWRRAAVNVASLALDENLDNFLALDEAILRLEGQDRTAAQVVRLRFFAGLSIEDTARILEVSPRTVKREWTYARTWLLHHLENEEEPQP
ncbi:MAG: sigma-70 family RNA polymerase sigma factor [Planctomycetota bacterium]|jgi:RNA polymerase sigma factor (TIGR02999 family)